MRGIGADLHNQIARILWETFSENRGALGRYNGGIVFQQTQSIIQKLGLEESLSVDNAGLVERAPASEKLTITQSQIEGLAKYMEAMPYNTRGMVYDIVRRLGFETVPDPRPNPDPDTVRSLTSAVWGMRIPGEAGDAGKAIATELARMGKKIVAVDPEERK